MPSAPAAATRALLKRAVAGVERVGGALRSIDFYAGRATPSKNNAKGKSKSRARHVRFEAVGDESFSGEPGAYC